jgi:hypothetical protein
VKLCWMHVCESTSKNVALNERLLSCEVSKPRRGSVIWKTINYYE